MEITMNVKCGCLDSARGIFDTMGVRDVFSWTSMVNGYAKSGELELARMSFNEMPERNVVSWSAMIAGKPPKGSFRMVCYMLEAAFVPMENISSCALCLWSIGLLGIWSVNPLNELVNFLLTGIYIDTYKLYLNDETLKTKHDCFIKLNLFT
jgi:pentatricopeptide repeat protein